MPNSAPDISNLYVQLPAELGARITAAQERTGWNKQQIVAAALTYYFNLRKIYAPTAANAVAQPQEA